MIFTLGLVHIAEWTSEKRAAYAAIFGPVLKTATKVLPKTKLMSLRRLHPELEHFSLQKLRNRVNADIQKARRQAKLK